MLEGVQIETFPPATQTHSHNVNHISLCSSTITMTSIKLPKATWSRITSSKRLYRSSQAVSTVGQKTYIFGGELLPREPVDNRVDVVSLDTKGTLIANYSFIVTDLCRTRRSNAHGSRQSSLTSSWQSKHHDRKQHLPLFRTRRSRNEAY